MKNFYTAIILIISLGLIQSVSFANDNDNKKRITSRDQLISLQLDHSFYNVLNARMQRNIPGANFAQYASIGGEGRLIFGQIIYLDSYLQSNSIDSFVEKYKKEMQKTQSNFTIELHNNQFTLHFSIIRGLEQICRGTLIEDGTKILQVCGRTSRSNYGWIRDILETVTFNQ